MVKIWATGLVLQALLMLAPVLLARYLIANSAQLLRGAAEQDARWRAGDLTDSLSLANQRAAARVARTYSITARGDTLFPLARVPSGRPDPTAVAARHQQAQRRAPYIVAVIYGLIPAMLILVTVVWLSAHEAGPSQTLSPPA
jgi:hypothetical protein